MTDQQQRLELLIADRLELLADRVEQLVLRGDHDTAELLKREGLHLASAYDTDETFLVIDTRALFQ